MKQTYWSLNIRQPLVGPLVFYHKIIILSFVIRFNRNHLYYVKHIWFAVALASLYHNFLLFHAYHMPPQSLSIGFEISDFTLKFMLSFVIWSFENEPLVLSLLYFVCSCIFALQLHNSISISHMLTQSQSMY